MAVGLLERGDGQLARGEPRRDLDADQQALDLPPGAGEEEGPLVAARDAERVGADDLGDPLARLLLLVLAPARLQLPRARLLLTLPWARRLRRWRLRAPAALPLLALATCLERRLAGLLLADQPRLLQLVSQVLHEKQ